MIRLDKNKRLFSIATLSVIISIIFIGLILIIPMFFEFFWNDALRTILANSTYAFRFITELGGTLIYLAIFFTIYWGINKNFARNLLMVYVASNFINFYAKSLIGNERPPESNWYLISASHLSTPSGHAQSSSVFWGYTAIKSRRMAMWIISISIIILVGLSRIYLGVHWFGDVLTGWLFGIILLNIAWILELQIKTTERKYNKTIVYLSLALFGFIVMILTESFLQIDYNFGSPGGQMIGLGLGFAIEDRYVKFDVSKNIEKFWKIILRIFIGIVLIAIVYLMIYLLIDTDIYWMNAIHYIITLFLGIVIWPVIFKKLNL